MPNNGTPRGLLYVEMSCPPGMEEEFNAWYNTEHIPERMGIKGFTGARRYMALMGEPRWLAAYEIESTAALETPEYLYMLKGAGQTAWTNRITSLVQVRRGVYDLAWTSGPAPRQPMVNPKGLLALRFSASGSKAEWVANWHDTEGAPQLLGVPGILSARRYRGVDPEAGQLTVFELADPWVVQSAAFAAAWRDGWGHVQAGLPAFKRVLYTLILGPR